MAFIQVSLLSKSLVRTVNVNVILPTDKLVFPGMPEPDLKDLKALYLLHGVFGSQVDWVNGTRIQRWAEENDLAVIMPAGENMFYVDQEAAHNFYGEFIGKELPEQMEKMFPLSKKREDRFIAGLSMGGYGALRNGLKYSENFGRIGAFSAALSVVEDCASRTNDTPIFLESRAYAESFFGDLDKVKESDKNPLWMMKKLNEEGKALPEIYMACGTKDSLYDYNIKFREAFLKEGAKLTWDEAPYAHEWDFWDLEVKKFIDWLPLKAAAGMNSGNIGL